MPEYTAIEKYILEKEADETGGVNVVWIGDPGSGKTVGLANVAKNHWKEGRICYWRGQESCQWILLAANDVPVTLWLHDSIKEFDAYVTGDIEEGIPSKEIDLETADDIDVEIRRFEDVEEIVEDPETDRVNVYYIPGDKAKNEKDRYFFLKTNARLATALNNRRWGNMVSHFIDEIGDVASTDTKKPFYRILNYEMPEEWGEHRKNRVSLHGVGHDTSDIHYKLWKVKANTRAYFQGADVAKQDRQVDQGQVNKLSKGEIVVPGYPGFEKDHFELPYLPHETIGWITDNENVLLRVDIEADIPDIMPDAEREQMALDDAPVDVDDLSEIVDVEEAADILDITERQVRNKIVKGELEAIQPNMKYLLARDNVEAVAS